MAELVATTQLSDLIPVAPEPGAGEGDPRPVYTCQVEGGLALGPLWSYPPSDGGAPRLVARANVGAARCLSVWDSGSGTWLAALQAPPSHSFESLVTYQRPSDGRPRVAAGSNKGQLCIFDGDGYKALRVTETSPDRRPIHSLAVYEEPTSGRTRLVTG
jgi:WD40 repeat protein